MPSKTIACLSNPSSSRSIVGFHCRLYLLLYLKSIFDYSYGNEEYSNWQKLFYCTELAFSTLVKSSKHKSGKILNANAAKTEFQRLRKEKRRYSRSQRSAELSGLQPLIVTTPLLRGGRKEEK